MPDLTSRLALKKPRGGSSGSAPAEQVDIDVINGNMDTLDGVVGLQRVTSTTRPSAPFDGQTIYETDTNRFLVYLQASTTWRPVANANNYLMNWAASGGSGSYTQVTGQAPMFVFGQAAGITSGTGVLVSTFAAPFPNGIAGVVLMPHQNSNFASYPVLVEASLSKTGFQSFWSGKTSAQVYIPYMAIGW